MRSLPRALARVRDHDRGTSLVEMLVVIILLSLILGAVASTMILGQRQAGSSSIRLDNSAQGRIGMEAMSKNLRTAVAPSQLVQSGQTCVTGSGYDPCGTTEATSATANSITFYANVNNDLTGASVGPSRVTYSVVQDPIKLWGNLVETVQASTAAAAGQYRFCTPGASCPVRSRVISRGLIWPIPAPSVSTPALFTYYDNVDAVLTPTPSLSPAQLALVDSMDVSLQVRTSSVYGTPSTTFVQRIVLTNASQTP